MTRVLIEDWLPAAAIGVECMREENNPTAKPPSTYLHVWWARRPLTVSRAAVLASLLPADFPRDIFERLLGFGRSSKEIVELRQLMDYGVRIPGGFGYDRAFKHSLREDDLATAHNATAALWGDEITVIDPMAGGGSIPFESARLGFHTLANEYNPVACTVLEVMVNYTFRFGELLGTKARQWGKVWLERIQPRLAPFFPAQRLAMVHAYIYARTVPCPDTGHATPLVSDWHLLNAEGTPIVAEPVVDNAAGTWTVRIREVGRGAGQLTTAPRPTYSDGKGISLFTNPLQREPSQIPSDYIKAMAQQGHMGSSLYAVALKGTGLSFRPAEAGDLAALNAAACELTHCRPEWERTGVLPTETFPEDTSDPRPRLYGMPHWADMFSSRQLLTMGVLVDELRRLHREIIAADGDELGTAIIHLLAFAIDKFANHNSCLSSWHAPRGVIRSVFDRHDFSFKSTFTEIAPCGSGVALEWAMNNTLKAYRELTELTGHSSGNSVAVTLGSSTNLPQLDDGSVTAVVVDPPYADNVQYSELANFFYVWLKRTLGQMHPEWFATPLCEDDQEAVVNVSRHRDNLPVAEAKLEANAFYQRLISETFSECRRILRDDGVLTVMFTHKKQEAWEALFASLIQAGFTVTATWPVKTESEHSLHQAKKNAAQSTVLLVARKRPVGAGVGYFNTEMRREIRGKALRAAERLQSEGLNAVDQLVGSFGPAMEVFSQFDEVKTDVGALVSVTSAIDEASEAVSEWRIRRLATRGLDGVEPEGQFALLCWDVLGAAMFRFNEAKLLGNAVGMDVDMLVGAGLVSKSGDNIKILSARDRRRERALEPDEVQQTLFGPETMTRRRTRAQVLKVHPNDPQFRTALDACHALALRYVEAGGRDAGIGSARGLLRQQGWTRDSAEARLMEALVKAAPPAVRVDTGRTSAGALYPEFRAWHALLEPLFDIEPPDWTVHGPEQLTMAALEPAAEDDGVETYDLPLNETDAEDEEAEE